MSRTNIEIFLGIIIVLVTGGLLVSYGLNEPNRMAEFEKSQQAQAIEVGAQLFDTNCKGCHGVQGEGVPGLCPPLNDKNFFTGRLKEVGWTGTQEDYIVSTVSGGRLASTRPQMYPGGGSPAMPAWSDRFGGPLRDDQIQDIAAFIMNWEATAPVREISPTLAGPPVGTDITQTLPTGDAVNGEALANSKGCVACHVTTTTGPAWAASTGVPGIGDRAATRFSEPDYTGKATSAEQYLLESIVNPTAFVVSGFQPLMPANFGQTLTAQEVADLIAYMSTIK
jgi:mono/diheme cytochrome c family protein